MIAIPARGDSGRPDPPAEATFPIAPIADYVVMLAEVDVVGIIPIVTISHITSEDS